MNIGKSTRKIKENTMGDFVSQAQNPNYQPGEVKRQHFFSDPEKDKVKQAIAYGEAEQIMGAGLLIGMDKKIDSMEESVSQRKAYNEKITELNPKYSTLQPNAGFILRCFIMTGDEGMNDSSSLIIGTEGLPKIPVKTRNGQAVWREVVDKFAYRGKAVIVAVPSVETDYKPGDIVQINAPRTACPLPESDFQIVEQAYLHPDSKHINAPTDVNDEDFGYVLVSRSQIILRLPKP